MANPLRKLATVITLTQNQKKFVNAAGVVAVYQAEGAATTEAAPTLTQPTLTCAMGRAAITASHEIPQDDPGLVEDLVRLIAAGRDRLDGTKFLVPSGTNEPLGIMVPGTTGSLTTTQRVQTAVADTFSPVDAYAVHNAIDPQARGNLSWVAHPTTWSYLYRMTPAGSETEPQLIPDFNDGRFLGSPTYDWSTMSTAQTVCVTGERVLIGGDFAAGVVVGDRIGMQVEMIDNVLDPTTGFPTGQRILFAHWRRGCVVVNANALRYLEIL